MQVIRCAINSDKRQWDFVSHLLHLVQEETTYLKHKSGFQMIVEKPQP